MKNAINPPFHPTLICVALTIMLVVTAYTPSILFYYSTTPSSATIVSDLQHLADRLDDSERRNHAADQNIVRLQTALDDMAEALVDRQLVVGTAEVDMTPVKSAQESD